MEFEPCDSLIPWALQPLHALSNQHLLTHCLGQVWQRRTIECPWVAAAVRTRAGLQEGCSQHEFAVLCWPQISVPYIVGALLGSPSFPWRPIFLLSQLPSLSLDYTSDMMANRNSVNSRARRRCSSAWRENTGHLRASHILVKGSTGTSLIWFLLFAQVTLDCRELFYKSSLVGLDLKFILRTFFWGSNFLRGLLCFVLFLSGLPGLFIRTINYFPLDLQFFAYAAATLWVVDVCLHTQMCVCVCVCGWRSGWMNICVCEDTSKFSFLILCENLFSTDFQGLSIACCIKKNYWIYTVWMKYYFKNKTIVKCSIKFMLNFGQMNIYEVKKYVQTFTDLNLHRFSL